MRVTRPQVRPRANEENWLETDGFPSWAGVATADEWGLELTDKEKRRLTEERNRKLAKRRPVGFAPWDKA